MAFGRHISLMGSRAAQMPAGQTCHLEMTKMLKELGALEWQNFWGGHCSVRNGASISVSCWWLCYLDSHRVGGAALGLARKDTSVASLPHWVCSLAPRLLFSCHCRCHCGLSGKLISKRSKINLQDIGGSGTFKVGNFTWSSHVDTKWFFTSGAFRGTLRICWSDEWMRVKWGSSETQPFVLAQEIFLLCNLLRD